MKGLVENEHFNSEGGLIIRDGETDLEQFLQIKQLSKSGVEKGVNLLSQDVFHISPVIQLLNACQLHFDTH